MTARCRKALLAMGVMVPLLWSAVSSADPPATPVPAEPAATIEKLPDLVESYFKSTSADERRRVASAIVGLEGATVQVVAEAVRGVCLWKAEPPGVQHFPLPGAAVNGVPEHVTTVHVHIPEGYDPARAYPLIVALHDQEESGERFLADVRTMLGADADAYIVAAPTDNRGAGLNAGLEEAADPVRLLDQLKRRYRVDSDRVYVLGRGMGGNAAFELAILYADAYAAIVSLNGTLALDSGAAGVELLLPNLRHTPALAFHEVGELAQDAGAGGVDVWNRHLDRLAARQGVELRAIALPTGGATAAATPPADPLAEWLNKKRPRRVASFDHWFRYPAQGRMGWVRLKQLRGEPWTAQQIVVAPALGETQEHAAREVLKEKLVYIGGDIEGQTLRVRAQGCDRLELLLNEELIDLTRNVIIYLDGTHRFEGPVRPSVSTLLEVAYEDWDFQRLWPVRFQVTSAGRAVQR